MPDVDVGGSGGGSIENEMRLEVMTHNTLSCDVQDEILKALRLYDDDETVKVLFKKQIELTMQQMTAIMF